MRQRLSGMNIPMAGFMAAAQARGWQLIPSIWAGASPSSYITRDAFERIAQALLDDVRAALAQGLDAIYLDLHGAAVAEHVDDCDGELLTRLRALVGPQLPIVASLDLHANVTQTMLAQADALVAYRTYPHVDMAATGERAAHLLARRLALGRREARVMQRLPFLIPLNAQSTDMAPAQDIYATLGELDQAHDATVSFCMGFASADIAECAPMIWAYAPTQAQAAAAVLPVWEQALRPEPWRREWLDASAAVAQALALAQTALGPVLLADTQDNPGAGGDSNTTGMLHALLRQRAGRKFPGRVALGMLFDASAAQRACEAGVGATLELSLGRCVPTFAGPSEPPVQGRFKVLATSDGVCALRGEMTRGWTVQLGHSACLEIEGVLVAVVSGKFQLLDREMLRMVSILPEGMKIIVVKSSNHFRADFSAIASHVLVAKSTGPMALDPAELPWKKINPAMRLKP
jgi:microcystin degradation protein MlrC